MMPAAASIVTFESAQEFLDAILAVSSHQWPLKWL
jgi:hypothetical protein